MKNRTKLMVIFLGILGVLIIGNSTAQAAPANHQISLKMLNVGNSSNNRNYPVFNNASQYVLSVKPYDTMRFHFPGSPTTTTITITSQVKIDKNSTGSAPYEYDGVAGFTVNPEDSTNEIKYDVHVEKAGFVFEVLDPIIIVDNSGIN